MRPRYRQSGKTLKFFLILIGLFLVIILIAKNRYNNYINTPFDKNDSTAVSFQIQKGETLKEVAANLEAQDLIKSDFALYLYGRSSGLDKNILAGRFVLNQSMTAREIVETITNPAKSEYVITIQEGLRVKDIDQKLVDLGLIQSGEFIIATKNFNDWGNYSFLDQEKSKNLEVPLEGYLYPDTYFLNPNDFHSEDLISLTLNNFEKKYQQINVAGSPILKKYSLHEVITMASIIENEVFGSEDRKLVSGILWKRYENNWLIGADATILYITDDRKITAQELEIDSPYNTRKNLGLPPGPISNPSIESIEAALFPKESIYWFYLTTLDTGEVIYAESNEEHNENRRKYL